MKAETKARQLFDKYCYAIRENEDDDGYFTNTIKAKRCALIAIDLVLDLNDIDGEYSYYLEVKQEIEKL
jgi:hypothetical protein